MTDISAYPPMPEPAAHILSYDLGLFQSGEWIASACSVPFRCADRGASEPLYTAQQMREYRDAPAEQSREKS